MNLLRLLNHFPRLLDFVSTSKLRQLRTQKTATAGSTVALLRSNGPPWNWDPWDCRCGRPLQCCHELHPSFHFGRCGHKPREWPSRLETNPVHGYASSAVLHFWTASVAARNHCQRLPCAVLHPYPTHWTWAWCPADVLWWSKMVMGHMPYFTIKLDLWYLWFSIWPCIGYVSCLFSSWILYHMVKMWYGLYIAIPFRYNIGHQKSPFIEYDSPSIYFWHLVTYGGIECFASNPWPSWPQHVWVCHGLPNQPLVNAWNNHKLI